MVEDHQLVNILVMVHPSNSTTPVLSHGCTGNLIIPNENYIKFEDWLAPILVRMTEEQVMGLLINVILTLVIQSL